MMVLINKKSILLLLWMPRIVFAQPSTEETIIESFIHSQHSLAYYEQVGDPALLEIQSSPETYLSIISSQLIFPDTTNLLAYAQLSSRHRGLIGILSYIDTEESRSILHDAYYSVSAAFDQLNTQLNEGIQTGKNREELLDLIEATSSAIGLHNDILSALAALNDATILEDVTSRIPGNDPSAQAAILNYHRKFSTQQLSYGRIIMTQKWNLIALPVVAINGSFETVFSTNILNSPPLLWEYESYTDSDTLSMGKSYWASPAKEGGSGKELIGVRDSLLFVEIAAGWNMIGGPSCDIHVSNITDPSGIIIPGSLQGFDNGYQPDSMLVQGEGYWIQTTSAGQITLDCNAAAKAAPSPLPAPPDFFGRIAVQDASGGNQQLYFGSTLPEDHSVSYGMPPRPPSGVFDARFAGNIRLVEETAVEVRLQSSRYPVTVTPEKAPDGATDFVLEELALGQVVATHPLDAPVVISNSEVTAFGVR